MKKIFTYLITISLVLNFQSIYSQKEGEQLLIQATPIKYTNNDCKGAIEIVALEGVQPFEYSIDAGKTFESKNVFENLCEGKYFIQVKDASGKLGLTLVDFVPPVPVITLSEKEQEQINQNRINDLLAQRKQVYHNWEKRRVVDYELSKLHVVYAPIVLSDIVDGNVREISFKMLVPDDVTDYKATQFIERIKNKYSENIVDIQYDNTNWIAILKLKNNSNKEIINDIFQRFSFSGFPTN